MVQYRTEKTLKEVMVFLLAAALVGRYVISPMTGIRSAAGMLFMGIGAVSAVIFVLLFAVTLIRNIGRIQVHRAGCPMTGTDAKKMGVDGPLDFCLLFSYLTRIRDLPMTTVFSNFDVVIRDSQMIEHGYRLFEQMFGRPPLNREACSWDEILNSEVEKQYGKKISELTESEFYGMFSDEVVRNINEMEKHEI